MLDDVKLSQLSPLARQFRARFFAELPHVSHIEEFTNRYELAIPAAHPAVGELRVWGDGDELTIFLGEHHHWHVPLYMFDEQRNERSVELAADEAVREIRDVLENRTILRLTRREGRVTRTMTYAQDADVSPPSAEETEYVWSGPHV